ncbi:Methyltransferase-like protein 7A [Araneus ventricosus]|uniref:Methyltransferase-like protein 7A n=1 Tax=Araneus ventricosus TaxID=182803 RepID=A0A4Y2L478_ARAVE|nr:Methyltransferase-like protein 7A [Araneus ventricosus]
MEFIIYTAVTVLLWVLSASCLLPFLIFLKFSKTYRDKWFSWFFVTLIKPQLSPALGRMRIRAFDLLKEHLEGRKRNTPLEILEIGIGAGSNLQFYPENSNLTVLDMNESFIEYFEENLKKYPQVIHKKTVIAMAEDMHELHDDSFDVVVCTYVLCSVKNVRSVLKEVKRVLKPGGKFLVLEHVMYPSSTWNAILQSLTSPLWNIYFDGCNLNRKNDEEIRNTGFSDVVIEKSYPKDIWMYIRPKIVGIATNLLRGPGLERARKRASDLLKKHLPDRKRNTPLEILEIGIEGGATLPFYAKNTNLTFLEPNLSMIKYFEENRQKYPQITYKKTVIAIAENMHEIDDDSFDVIVGIYVLCSVKSVRSALKEVKRVLKPGGKYLFAEHIIYPGFTWETILQNLINPFWRVYYNGCNLNRNHDEEIRKAGFSDFVAEKSFPKDIWLYAKPQITGVATK